MNKKVNKKERHSRLSLSGISLIGVVNQIRKQISSFIKTEKVGDPRQQHSGMTTLFNNGFTLIELLVVVLIIGILSAIALPQYEKAVNNAHFTQLITASKSILEAEKSYFLANNTYTTDATKLDIEFPIAGSTDIVQVGKGRCFLGFSNLTNSERVYCDLPDRMAITFHRFYDGQRLMCCSYNDNQAADKLCKTVIGTTSGSNLCSESSPCMCYTNW